MREKENECAREFDEQERASTVAVAVASAKHDRTSSPAEYCTIGTS